MGQLNFSTQIDFTETGLWMSFVEAGSGLKSPDGLTKAVLG
ncbi:Hypothetical protein DEACI_0394 [Acididesulfobacillus acetoxydans]|uniref:Uncharacterized protein n=1 Tax=Acididesulfobacillus acetoxydans TaxID=1561005 RepID=A0A8S0XUV0_9FIRM|nr:hypothetical protein [Acididesulfobacillus acetoxydans]CAA7599767.1 Hypothetical protein DEACI_0394 [Acididesulfobacillus acetoxydans]